MSSEEITGADSLSATICIVCGDKASGTHYTVPSCNGCKTFFRRAIVNNRSYVCDGDGNCFSQTDKHVVCRACRLSRCLSVGMNPKAIQGARDKIGYTKRKKHRDEEPTKLPHDTNEYTPAENLPTSSQLSSPADHLNILERLAQLEYSFSSLLNRNSIVPYASLEEALRAPSRFSRSGVSGKLEDEPGTSLFADEFQKWRAQIIALYVDWAKMLPVFRQLPRSDKLILINNHAASYLIMSQAFRPSDYASSDPPSSASLLISSTMLDEVNSRAHYSDAHIKKLLDPPITIYIKTALKRFHDLEISAMEFGALQAIMFFDTEAEGLDGASQRNVAAEQKKLVGALHAHISQSSTAKIHRFANIILTHATIRKLAARKKESIQLHDICDTSRLSRLVRETVLGIMPSKQPQPVLPSKYKRKTQ